jgi:predicted nucleic acid-binding protein
MSVDKKVFVDTNLWIYSYSSDELKKHDRAREIIDQNNVVISTQVLNEFSNVLNKKFKSPWLAVEMAIAEITASSSVVLVTTDTIQAAIAIAERYNFSYYDSLIISSALENHCEYLYSEDLAHTQKIEASLYIINPFK